MDPDFTTSSVFLNMPSSRITSCQMLFEDIPNTHDTFMKSLGTELSDDDKRLPYLYWIPKLHKSPVKHRFIAGSSRYTTKQLSSFLTQILAVIKTGLEKYYSIKTSHTGVNNMWILKNYTDLLSSLGHLGVHRATSIQTFYFSTLYTSIPHDLLKCRMNNVINNAFNPIRPGGSEARMAKLTAANQKPLTL